MLRNLNQVYSGGKRRLGLCTTGIRGDQIPSTGTSSPPWMYPSLVLPADAAKEYAYWIESHNFPFGLPLGDLSAGTIAGLPDGTYTAQVTLEEWGVLVPPGPFTATLVVGSADETLPTLSGSIGITSLVPTGFVATCPVGADNVAVTQYRWRLNGSGWTVIGSGGRSVTITGRTPVTTDLVEMAAGDAAGNWSPPLSANVDLPAAADNTAPTLTGAIVISGLTNTSFTATCPVATDNVGVVGYQYRFDGGTYTDIAAAGRSVTFSGLTPGSTHTLDMRAKDALPLYSSALSTSQTLPLSETTVPTLTGALVASAVTPVGYTLTWPAGADNVAVASYERSLDGGATWLDVGNVLVLAVTGRTPGSTDEPRVRCKDPSGNLSTPPLATSVPLPAVPELYTLLAPQDQINHVGGFLRKAPAAQVWLVFNFRRYFASVSNPVVTIVREGGAADPAPAAMLDGAPLVSGNLVLQRVIGGVEFTDYDVQCQADGPAGERQVMSGRLPVRPP